MQTALLLATGGIAGTLSRFYLGTWLIQRLGGGFPFATLLINVTGCFVLGLVGTLAAERTALATPELRLLVGVGFCGAYTTFSTFGVESDSLFRAGSLTAGYLYVGLSVLCGLLAVRLGVYLGGGV